MAKKIPKFSYTGAYETSSDDTYWYIKLKSSGKMTFTYRKNIEVGCVGGGGGTISNRNYAHIGGFAGGGGGYIKTGTTTAEAGTAYAVTIGAGGKGITQLRAIRRLNEVTFCRAMHCPSRCTNCPATPTRLPTAVVR